MKVEYVRNFVAGTDPVQDGNRIGECGFDLGGEDIVAVRCDGLADSCREVGAGDRTGKSVAGNRDPHGQLDGTNDSDKILLDY